MWGIKGRERVAGCNVFGILSLGNGKCKINGGPFTELTINPDFSLLPFNDLCAQVQADTKPWITTGIMVFLEK
jgi:hypothetical protein